MAICDKVINVALDQVSYLEKKSNKDLNSKTANADSTNNLDEGRLFRKRADNPIIADIIFNDN